MNRLTAIRLIATREVRERTRSRIFRLGTLMTVLIVVAAVVFPALAKSHARTPSYVVGITQPAPEQLATSVVGLGPSIGANISVDNFSTRDAGVAALQNRTITMLIVPGSELVTRVAVDPSVTNGTTQLLAAISDVTRLYSGLESQGLNPQQTSAALEHPAIAIRSLEPAAYRDSKDASAATGGMILLFVFLTLYGAFILNGVIEEKTSRVVEILLSSVRPNELLIGKVVGIGIVGSIQGAALVVATLIARAATPGGSANALTPTVIAYTLLWFALGFAMFAWLYACAGALVSRSEDAQNLVFPLQLPLVASYLVALLASANGPNAVLNFMSMFPFTAPMTMLERMAARQVPLWQVLVSISLCMATSYIVMRIAVTIFAGGILRSGQRVKLREAWRNPL